MVGGAGFTAGTEMSILCVITVIFTQKPPFFLSFNEQFVLIDTRL